MTKEKDNLANKIGRGVIGHPWLKLIALILAILVWLYVQGEINRFN